MKIVRESINESLLYDTNLNYLIERYLDAYDISKPPAVVYTVLEHNKRLPNVMTIDVDIYTASPKNYGLNTPQKMLEYIDKASDYIINSKSGWFNKKEMGPYANIFWNIKGLKVKPYEELPRKRALAFLYGLEAMVRHEYLGEPVKFYEDYFNDVYDNLEKEQKMAVKNMLRKAAKNQL